MLLLVLMLQSVPAAAFPTVVRPTGSTIGPITSAISYRCSQTEHTQPQKLK